MARVKRGTISRKKHKKLLKQAKGYTMTNRRLVKRAKEAVLHAGEYAFHGRKLKKREFRKLWIIRINAALKSLGKKYNSFIRALKLKKIILDRKILAYLAKEEPEIFNKVVKEAFKK